MSIKVGDVVVVNEEADACYSYTDVGSVGRVRKVTVDGTKARVYFYLMTGNKTPQPQWSIEIEHLTFLGDHSTTKEQSLALAKLMGGTNR